MRENIYDSGALGQGGRRGGPCPAAARCRLAPPRSYIPLPMLPLLLAASLAAAQVPDSAHVVLVATTDVHGHTTGWDYVAHRPASGGLALVAPVVDSLRRRYPGQVVVLDAGDMLQGDPFATYYGRVRPTTPHPVIEAMNLVGYDVATPGNHDFDFGVPRFERAVGDAAFPYVSANLRAVRGDTLIFPPFRVLQRQGVRVGVAGLTTPGATVWNGEELRGRLRVARIAEAAAPALQTMRQVADLTVVLAHSGLTGPSSYDTAGVGGEDAAAALAALPSRPDVVIVGHSHREIRDTVIGGVHFVQPRRYGEGVAVVHVDLRRVGGRWDVTRIRAQLVRTGGRTPSPLLSQRLAAAHDAVRQWVDEPIGEAVVPLGLTDGRARPTPLHDFVLETLRRRARADLAAGPVYELRAGLARDTIRRAHVLALYPYDNVLKAVRVSGTQLKAYLEWSARYFRTDAAGRVTIDDAVPGYDFDLVRGARYDIDLRRRVGDRIRNLAVRGRPVAPTDSFTLAVNDHRQAGAGGYDMLRGAPVVHDRRENIPDLLVEEIRARGTLDSGVVRPSEWRIVPEVAAVAVRRLFDVAPEPLRPSPRDTVLLRILGTAELGEPVRLGATVARVLDSLAADCGCATLRVDAGNALQGGLLANLTAGRSSLAALEPAGYDAAVPGDRDFDWSADTLARRIAESKRLWVAANLADSATGRPVGWVPPYGMLERGGLRIAVLGYITPETKPAQPGDRTRGLRFGAGELGLHEALERVRAERPDLTVLLANERGSCDGTVCGGELIRLAEQLSGSGVDLIVGSGAAGEVETRVGGVAVVAPPADGIAVTEMVRTDAGGRALRIRIEPIDTVGVPGVPARHLERLADSLRRRVVAQIKRPLGRADRLPTLVAEARRNAARADLGLVRRQALAADLPAGPATYVRLQAVEPAEADLVVVRLTGAELRDLLERALAEGPPAVELAGAKVRYDPSRPPGRRLRSIELAGRRKLRPEESYTLVTDERSAAGAGALRLPPGGAERLGMIDAEAVAVYLRRLPQPVEVEAVPVFESTRR